MKYFFTATLLLFVTVSSFALEPQVGDSATYKTTYAEGNATNSSIWQKTILEFKEESQWQYWSKVRWESDSPFGSTQEEWVAFAILFYIDSTEGFCEKMQDVSKDAQLEQISVPAGTFMSCKVLATHGGEQTWYSKDVPFGVLKRVLNFGDGSRSEDILTGFNISQ